MKFDAVIFDVDGVLIDVTDSFYLVIKASVLYSWKYIFKKRLDCSCDFSFFIKTAKSTAYFNDDYDLACNILIFLLDLSEKQRTNSLKKLLSDDKIFVAQKWREYVELFNSVEEVKGVIKQKGLSWFRELCYELYFGSDFIMDFYGVSVKYVKNRMGFWHLERKLVDFHWTDLGVKVGIFTGRDKKEMFLGLKLLGWEDFPLENIITVEDAPPKPSGKGLVLLAERLQTPNILYVGDSGSDYSAFLDYRNEMNAGYFVKIGKPILQKSFKWGINLGSTKEFIDRFFGKQLAKSRLT